MQEFKILPFLKSNSGKLFVLTTLANAGLVVVGNQKSLILVVALFGLGLFFLTKRSLFPSIFFATLLVLPFEYGLRSWEVAVITSQIPTDGLYGYSFYFGLSLKLVGAATCLLLLLHFLKKKFHQFSSFPIVLIFVWFGWILASSYFAINQDIAWLYVARISIPIALFVSGTYLYLCFPRDTIQTTLIIIAGTVLVQGLVGGYQLAIGSLSGLYLEESARSIGFWTTDGISQFRASGLMGHPTFYGSFLSMMLPVLLRSIVNSKPTYSPWLRIYWSLALGAAWLGIIGSISRSAWLVSAGFMGYLYLRRRELITKSFLVKLLVGLTAVTIMLYSSLIAVRLQSFADFLRVQGNGPARLSLIVAAIQMGLEHPLLGVGPNHFTAAIYSVGLDQYTQYFIFPVHNVPLLFMAEIGLVGSMALFLFIGIVIKMSYLSHDWSRLGGFWFGAIAYILSAQVHPLLNQDPTFDYFMLFMGFLYASTINHRYRHQKQTG